MAKVKTAELIGAALDWAVAKCEGHNPVLNMESHGSIWHGWYESTPKPDPRYRRLQAYSTDWVQGGPIIQREGINLSVDYQDDALSDDMVPIGWKGNLWNNSVPGTAGFLQWAYGPTPLIAAMRCFVASKLGDEVEIPKSLL